MNKMLLGVILLVAAGIVGYLGYNESQTFGSKVNEVFSGSPSNKAMYFYIVAAVCALAGIFFVAKK